MADGILAGRGLRTCGPVQRDYSSWPVSTSHLATVAIIGRSSENGEVDPIHAPTSLVEGVDVDVRGVELDSAANVTVDIFLDLLLLLEIFILALDELVNKRESNCQSKVLSLEGGHDLDVLSCFRKFFLEAWRVDVSLSQ